MGKLRRVERWEGDRERRKREKRKKDVGGKLWIRLKAEDQEENHVDLISRSEQYAGEVVYDGDGGGKAEDGGNRGLGAIP